MLEITTTISKKLEILADTYALDLIVLFGSQATGKTHAQSDVDVAIYRSNNPCLLEDLWRIGEEMKPIFQNPDIEVIDIATAPPILLRDVFDVGVCLYEKRLGTFSLQRMRARRMYRESAPLRRLRDQKLQEFLVTHIV